jgi:YD repeat-containing protein
MFLLVGQSLGSATAADTPAVASQTRLQARVPRATVASVDTSDSPHPRVHHAPVPRRPLPDYAARKRYAALVPKAHGLAKAEHVALPIDLTSLHHVGSWKKLGGARIGMLSGASQSAGPAALPASVTGIWPWWTYQTRTIPGVGTALVNVVNLNFLIVEQDVSIPTGEVDLAFGRTYNSESLHDANNDDNSTPSVFGNRWTNNLDVHLGWSSTGQNTGIVSIYTADGARDDYSCEIDIVETCTSQTTGVYELLGTADLSGGVACQFQWTKKSGVSYVFNAPYAACGNGQGSYGRLLRIYGRNDNFYLNLAYTWSPNDSSAENISQITVTHQPDGKQLTLTFAQIAGTSITELSTITTPDGETVNYHYTNTGDLDEIDKPGNNPVIFGGQPLPTHFLDGNPIATGNLPETYDIENPGLMEVCGPRAAISIIDTYPNNPTDGACVDFDYNNHLLSDWWTRGVLNPTPGDNVSPSPIQTGVNTGFVQWDDTTFFNNQIQGGCSGTIAGMSDVYNHSVDWCYNSNGLVIQTSVAVAGSNSLTTSQTWDSNNDVNSVTDARGNTTNLAYDANGNVVEVSLPSQTTSAGALRPTYLYDYDSHNNLTYYCDPANNASNGWNPSPHDNLCEQSGSTHYTRFKYYNSDPTEAYGCLTDAYTPSTYDRAITYTGGTGQCGLGLPNEVQGSPYPQATGSNGQPTQIFTYNTIGNLTTYSAGYPSGATWQIGYSSNGMDRVISRTDPDGVASYACYNQDGSVFFSETPQQDKMDGNNGNGPNCPSVSQLEGGATPPPYAAGYTYDPDGDVATFIRHHNCTGASNCGAANHTATTKCNMAYPAAGTTCNFYDGLDRLVEVKQPYDTQVDLYQNPWITRYLYDLTGGQQTFRNQLFSAYGNLFEVEELLPASPSPSVTAPPSPGSVSNPNYNILKAMAYDGVDRPVAVYSAMSTGSQGYTTDTLTWDTSPIPGNTNVAGFLGKDCNSAPTQQCQWFDYTPDGQEMTFESSDGSSNERDYTYDPDGRPTQIASPAYTYPQAYTYNVDGDLVTAKDAANDTADRATLTYNRYIDGTEESLDVSSGTLTQTGLFTYSYRKDGPLTTLQINDGQVSGIHHAGTTTLTYTYTNAGRLSTRKETGAAAPSPAPTTSITYTSNPGTGLVYQESTPVTGLSSFQYTAEDELTAVTSSGGNGSCSAPTYSYSLRGELINSPNCNPAVTLPFMANGVSLRTSNQWNSSQYTWNDLTAVTTDSVGLGSTCGGTGGGQCESSWFYDSAGRMTLEFAPYPLMRIIPPPANTITTRTYDAENHLNLTTFENGLQSAWPYEKVSWGPDGHPMKIGTGTGACCTNEQDERLHWNGNQLLFSTHLVSGLAALDDVKVGVQGDILPLDSGYKGLTFYDRGPGGTIMGCHNYTGTSYIGMNDSWATVGAGPCAPNQSSGSNMPTSTVWAGTPFTLASPSPLIGQGGTLGMPRTDGFTDGFDTIQGVRSYDSMATVWTAPDALGGVLDDPASQKSYMWNGNNPMDNVDPSGYSLNHPQPVDSPSPDPLGLPNQDELETKACGRCLLTIGSVTSNCHGGCMWHSSEVMNAVGVHDQPPVCKLGEGGYICQDANYQWRRLPNIMGTGKYLKCGVNTFVNSLPSIVLSGTAVGGLAGKVLGIVGLGTVGEYAGGPFLGAATGFVQSYTGIGCGGT